MRTKTLFLTAVLGIAGAVSASAQVYLVNAVGYVTVSMPKGFSMVANPLKATDSTIKTLIPTAPDGTTLYKFNPATGTYTSAGFDGLDNAWLPNPNITLTPGEGAFVNATAAFSNTFVGEVSQGALKTSMPAGFSIVSSQVPQEGRVDTVLGFPNLVGAIIYQYDNATGTYKTAGFDDLDNAWLPAVPTPKVGEAFWVKLNAPADWNRTFNINTP
jgi:hypothetical protein